MAQSPKIGRFLQLSDNNHLILHITTNLLSGQPLSSMRLEELKIIRLACLLTLGRGIELLILRETVANTGVSDNTILNRKISPIFWIKLYQIMREHVPSTTLNRAFSESAAANLSKNLIESRANKALLTHMIRSETGIILNLPDELLTDGNILFSVGTVYGHRLFRLLKFFNMHWGKEAYEPAIRVICQKIWFFYLIAWKKIIVSPEAFCVQRSEHELGAFSFLIQDYLTFTGTLWRKAPPISTHHKKAITQLLCGAIE
uniref:Protein UL79 n=1 Tax=Mastomys natalensis cytomegalovirus 2 TaxID=2973540 RepID=A0A9Y1IQF3_9BETA|nr:protein UL79 [Mastomys natalensis cytomegalovirus 2]WEG69214.1 protein UL79 [Mastomys natalensis cytomegalovirus 2]WEG69353.1 protein UL79 [Mastomys natalensis cytomegalovirus 2]WEG69491.1 protein UL79 [Mastomys natalensis cytomegalovirus 2]WEG69629.1 protein UL79 [Mastomys natalensis cytomegalovirus 2]